MRLSTGSKTERGEHGDLGTGHDGPATAPALRLRRSLGLLVLPLSLGSPLPSRSRRTRLSFWLSVSVILCHPRAANRPPLPVPLLARSFSPYIRATVGRIWPTLPMCVFLSSFTPRDAVYFFCSLNVLPAYNFVKLVSFGPSPLRYFRHVNFLLFFPRSRAIPDAIPIISNFLTFFRSLIISFSTFCFSVFLPKLYLASLAPIFPRPTTLFPHRF